MHYFNSLQMNSFAFNLSSPYRRRGVTWCTRTICPPLMKWELDPEDQSPGTAILSKHVKSILSYGIFDPVKSPELFSPLLFTADYYSSASILARLWRLLSWRWMPFLHLCLWRLQDLSEWNWSWGTECVTPRAVWRVSSLFPNKIKFQYGLL